MSLGSFGLLFFALCSRDRFIVTEPIFGRSFSLLAQIATEMSDFRKHLPRLRPKSRELNLATDTGHGSLGNVKVITKRFDYYIGIMNHE